MPHLPFGRWFLINLDQSTPTAARLVVSPRPGLAAVVQYRIPDIMHRAAAFVDKILKGALPAEKPIERPTKFYFVVNLKTAKALGITIPPSILLRAAEAIE